MSNTTLLLGDCLTVMATLEANSIDAIVTDPPAGIAFMGKHWDKDKGGRKQWIAWMTDIAAECLRLLKPGGHAFVWALPRTSHWTATAWEDAGFELRDCVYHIFGSGFPKSMDIGKQIDKMMPRAGMFDAFASHFAEQRKASGLSQKSVAAHFPSKTGGMTGCVWNWENGANVPTFAQWRILQPLLCLSNEWLPLIERIEAEREVIGQDTKARSTNGKSALPTMGAPVEYQTWDITAPATDAARAWDGWGTSMKPAVECWWLLRKPLSEPTVAANCLKWGTGAINVDACRIEANGQEKHTTPASGTLGRHGIYGSANEVLNGKQVARAEQGLNPRYDPQGRWPANLVLSDDAAALLDEMSGERKGDSPGRMPRDNKVPTGAKGIYGHFSPVMTRGYVDTETGASRFFLRVAPDADAEPLRMGYYPKASRKDRDEGLEGMPEVERFGGNASEKCMKCGRQRVNVSGQCVCDEPDFTTAYTTKMRNFHPTVKPTSLMRWLVRLITPPGGVVLDNFCGSGSTGKAAVLEGFSFIGIDTEAEYLAIAEKRIAHAAAQVEAKMQMPLLELA